MIALRHLNVSETSDDILIKIKGELTEQSLDCWETVLGGHGVQALVSTT